ncbi:C2 calcium-dependent domain-containing protein 4C-like [Pomacea canaliculata]|uniref:C2 calcium-dependent domain-containing protein 4C-like n=1 Tax=Pomacea canaliculata TaxID=400727 RepID=UPI000D731087|nr:C2 calcium-dependent domain-containing protein 4C-like [Pomacea canaliculata]XP_025077480.1 C2 calcium-dependent domain-containing protein 4C-like [Pomacea canaliculata]XP_025077481.1 C2 calcium-dependent domain-containing protein 4C-like [Pomacea canaliculata]XP_025077482.1 C2 calcium-dependent domain-containing protein 4C-like [Pomacea canaliculata]XP_025077483.1 C2 calcium-dependent domain-containing protein 4C-like [Pomacea canaliculata]
MDSMKELKDWLVTKCRLPGFQHQTLKPPEKSESKFVSNLVTPQTIPEFVIPGSSESSRNPSICSSDDLRSHSSGMSVTCSPNTSPAVSPRNSFSGLGVPDTKSPVRVRSAPVSPRRDSHGFLRDFGARSLSNLPYPRENPADPANPAAAEHPHVRSRSSCGFSTLKDNPHMRRKESLPPVGRSDGDQRLRGFVRRPFRSHESLFATMEAAGAAGAVTDHSTPGRCSPVFADQNDYLPLRESFRRSQRYYRRRSSLAQVEMTTALWRQARDNHDVQTRRIAVVDLMTVPADPCKVNKRHSAPSCTPAPSSLLMHKASVEVGSSDSHQHEACSSGATCRENCSVDRSSACPGGGDGDGHDKTLTERGEIKFSFQYFPATRRLKLLLIRGENLRFPERPDIVTNPFFKVSLMPGKVQKQVSETVKHTSNPVYNREFFFNDINMDELRNLRLRIKAFHKGHNLKMAEYLGEVNIPLANYDLLMENRMWTDLHFKPYEQDLGHLQVELLLEPREERLTVGLCRPRDYLLTTSPARQVSTGRADVVSLPQVSLAGKSRCAYRCVVARQPTELWDTCVTVGQQTDLRTDRSGRHFR